MCAAYLQELLRDCRVTLPKASRAIGIGQAESGGSSLRHAREPLT